MKNKFTSILMTLIIVAIISASVLLIRIIIKDINGDNTSETLSLLRQIQNEEKNDNNEEITSKNIDKTETTKINVEKKADKTLETPTIRETTKSNPLTELERVDNEKQTSPDYNNVTINKYFYNQLNNYSQTIYKAFESNKENMKTGTYKIDLGSSFSNLLEENGQKALGEYYQSAIEAYTYDNPDVFYIDPSKMYLNIETITRGSNKTYNLYIDWRRKRKLFNRTIFI